MRHISGTPTAATRPPPKGPAPAPVHDPVSPDTNDPETLRPEPWAAEDVSLNDDGDVEVTLREGMTWHDGESVTAEDVKFTYEYVGEHSPEFRNRVAPIESIEVTGDSSLVFSLSRPYAPLFHLTFATVFLLPEHVWADVPGNVDAENASEWPNSDPVGSGPFQFEEWRKGEELRLSRFDDHFHPPAIETLTHVVGGSPQATIGSLEAGDIDLLTQFSLPPQSYDRLEGASAVTRTSVPSPAQFHLSFHNKRKPGSDPAFRRACVLGGRGTVEKDSKITSPVEYWHNENLEQRSYDPERARTILEDAGYTWDDQDRLRYPPDA